MSVESNGGVAELLRGQPGRLTQCVDLGADAGRPSCSALMSSKLLDSTGRSHSGPLIRRGPGSRAGACVGPSGAC
jgi:hypothetical protein